MILTLTLASSALALPSLAISAQQALHILIGIGRISKK
jgi:hypothetical protein